MALFEDFEDEEGEAFVDEEETLPEETSNRTFIIAASVLGGIILLALACVAIYALVVLPQQRAASLEANEAASAQETEVVQMLTESANSTALAQTPLASPSPIFSPTASPTPVVAVATDTPTATPNIAATGTIAAALTQAADAILTIVPTSSALPDGGFADDVGIPGLVMMMFVFIAVIFFARRLRKAPTP
ncbi:MAG: hypothetical protein HN392_01870 [Anaerolineae bacterium]|jgi:hypothetical protein|nr:hypothetical protein [Anaerolineae bacterium]MBT7075186.1 hypothetical protein [Anaerolineae bacterium]MBT7783911.1 hypothetical protein [Anaerolineae bacterium]